MQTALDVWGTQYVAATRSVKEALHRLNENIRADLAAASRDIRRRARSDATIAAAERALAAIAGGATGGDCLQQSRAYARALAEMKFCAPVSAGDDATYACIDVGDKFAREAAKLASIAHISRAHPHEAMRRAAMIGRAQ